MATRDSEEPEEPGFRVTDRRRAGREEPRDVGQAATAPGTPGPEPAGHAEDEAREADIRLLSVPDLVRVLISELYARAWVHMGLVVNPATNLLAVDLPQARLAIDCIGSLAEHLGSFAEESERRELELMLTDLRVNFVRQSGT